VTWVSDAEYGTCDTSLHGCGVPLDIQSWPECDRNFSSYGGSPSPKDLSPHRSFLLNGNYKIPTVSIFEGRFGAQLEMYTGQTTVVIFADDPKIARRAAHVLARAIAPKLSSISPATLRARAVDRSGCKV